MRKQANGDFTKMGSEKTEAGPDVTTRRVDVPKPGLVCQESEEYGKRAHAEGICTLNLPEWFENKTLQPVFF